MARKRDILKLFLTPKTIIPAQSLAIDEKVRNACREAEWEKYLPYYRNLLASNTFYRDKTQDLLSPGFIRTDGQEYISVSGQNPLNLDKLVYDSMVKRPKMIWLPCMDERLQYLTASHHALSLGMPGCECLMSSTQKLSIAQEIAEICQKNPTIEEIVVSSHSGCGAVAKAIQQQRQTQHWVEKFVQTLQPVDQLLDTEGGKYAQSFADILSKTFEKSYILVTVRTHHFEKKELHSQNLHHAFGAVINFDPLLNTAEFEDGLEIPMFNIYAGGQEYETVFDHIALAVSIASGDHGFGNGYFTRQSPFVLLFTSNLKKYPGSVYIIAYTKCSIQARKRALHHLTLGGKFTTRVFLYIPCI
jgi:carbonic anhydrase